MTKVHVAFGTIVNEIKEVSRSYKEAKMALDVGKIFYSNKNVVAYSNLGIGRLIYQLPLPLCRMFIKEIFDLSLIHICFWIWDWKKICCFRSASRVIRCGKARNAWLHYMWTRAAAWQQPCGYTPI